MPTHAALSVVIPAYNEARRLPPYLEAVRKHLDERFGSDYEVIVVDDGSRDELPRVLEEAAANWPQLRSIRHAENRGKGAAVRTGMLAAAGRYVLFADADGATPIEEQARLAAELDGEADMAIGSRLAPGADQRRHWWRSAAGRLFAVAGRRLLRLGVHDTQCGFKMFTADAARRLFEPLEETGFLFDLELLARAGQLGLRVAEVPIRWQEVSGGHLHPIRSLPKIVVALFRIRRRLKNRSKG